MVSSFFMKKIRIPLLPHDDGYDPNDRFPDDGYIPDEDTYNNYQGDRDESTYRWDFEKKIDW